MSIKAPGGLGLSKTQQVAQLTIWLQDNEEEALWLLNAAYMRSPEASSGVWRAAMSKYHDDGGPEGYGPDLSHAGAPL